MSYLTYVQQSGVAILTSFVGVLGRREPRARELIRCAITVPTFVPTRMGNRAEMWGNAGSALGSCLSRKPCALLAFEAVLVEIA